MSDPSITVVLIEDEKQIRRFVRTALEGIPRTPISKRRFIGRLSDGYPLPY